MGCDEQYEYHPYDEAKPPCPRVHSSWPHCDTRMELHPRIIRERIIQVTARLCHKRDSFRNSESGQYPDTGDDKECGPVVFAPTTHLRFLPTKEISVRSSLPLSSEP